MMFFIPTKSERDFTALYMSISKTLTIQYRAVRKKQAKKSMSLLHDIVEMTYEKDVIIIMLLSR